MSQTAIPRWTAQTGSAARTADMPGTIPPAAGGTVLLYRPASAKMPARPPAAAETLTRTAGAPSVVVYHHVAERADAFTDKLLVTTRPETFRAHMRFYRKHYDLIAPGDLETGKLPKRPLLVTFDDAYRSVCEVASPILREFGAEALFFINPSAVLDRRMPTDNLLCLAATVLGEDELAKIVGCRASPAPTLPRLLMTVVARLPAPELARFRQAVLDRLGYTDATLYARSNILMTPDHLTNLRSYGLHAANHTMTHRMLHALSPAELAYEIRTSKERIEQATGQPVRWFSLPYGWERDATAEALSIAAASGHIGTFLVQGRLNRFRPAPDLFYRVSPRDVRPSLLPVSLSLLPALRTLRHAVRRRPEAGRAA